jgi:hypothetical protein
MGPIPPCRPGRRGERAGRRRLSHDVRARGQAGPAVPRRRALPPLPRGRRAARSARAADRHRLQDVGGGPGQRHRPAAVRRRVRQPTGGRRRPRVAVRANLQRRPRPAAQGARRRARGPSHGGDQPRLRGGRAAAGSLRRGAAPGLLAGAAAAALPLLQRQGPGWVDDRHRAYRPGRAARACAAGLPAVQRLPPDGIPEAPLRPGYDRDGGRSRAAAADPGAERHLPERGVRGGGSQVPVVRRVPDARTRRQRSHAGRASARAARRAGAP